MKLAGLEGILRACTAMWIAGTILLFVVGRSTLGVVAAVVTTCLLITVAAVARLVESDRRYREREVQIYGKTIAMLCREMLDLDWPESHEKEIRAVLASADEALWAIAGEGSREAYELRKPYDLPLTPL
jgi:uncharacterized protein involved in response to NO